MAAHRPLQPLDQMAALGGNTSVSRHSTTTSSRTATFQAGERRSLRPIASIKQADCSSRDVRPRSLTTAARGTIREGSTCLTRLLRTAMHLAHLKAPDLWPPVGLSRQHDSETRSLNAAVFALRYHVEGFSAALELYRFSRSKPRDVNAQLAWDWQWLGIHEAAMRIWFLRVALDILRKNWVPACASVAPHADDTAMEAALSLFDKYFPDFHKMRNAVAHAPGLELARTKPLPKDGLYSGPQLKNGNRFELVNDGIRYSMDMTNETLSKLTEVLLAFWSAFTPVERAFDERGRSE